MDEDEDEVVAGGIADTVAVFADGADALAELPTVTC